MAEHRSVAAVAALLSSYGVDCEVGVYGLPTAFRASADGTDRAGRVPTIAVLAEYDALPHLGHACGHNVICAVAIGAFLAARGVVNETGGRLILLGTPGEEGHGGKELMARAGAFDDIDAAVMVHPAGLDLSAHAWLGARTASISFHGAAAHASATPFLGRNALDAIVLAYQGVGLLRQQILPEDRIHMIISDGGTSPGVIPALTRGQVGVRSADPESLRELTMRVNDALTAAATMTGTSAEITWDERPPYLPVRSNDALAERYAVNIEAQGRRLVPPGVIPASLAASTDLGNVSVRIPAIHPMIKLSPPHVNIHTPEFARFTTGEHATAAIRDGASALALTMADFLSDAELREDVAAVFDRQGGAINPAQILAGVTS